MLNSSSCDYSDAYILVTGDVNTNNTNKTAVFKYCAPFTNCIIKINNIQVENAKGTDVVRPIYMF